MLIDGCQLAKKRKTVKHKTTVLVDSDLKKKIEEVARRNGVGWTTMLMILVRKGLGEINNG